MDGQPPGRKFSCLELESNGSICLPSTDFVEQEAPPLSSPSSEPEKDVPVCPSTITQSHESFHDPSSLLLPLWPEKKKRKPREKSSDAKLKRQFFEPIVKDLFGFCGDGLVERFLKADSTTHQQIALIILRRKLAVRDVTLPDTRGGLKQAFTNLPLHLLNGSSKRIEENNKFVFKHAIKLMKRLLFASLDKSFSKHSLESEFFNRYFKASSEETQKEIELVFRSLQNGSKPLSHSFYLKVFANQEFRKDFIDVVCKPSIENSRFIQFYGESTLSKLVKLFKRFQLKFDKNEITVDLQNEIINYFQNNKQCKLPWTNSEVKSAVECFLRTVGILF